MGAQYFLENPVIAKGILFYFKIISFIYYYLSSYIFRIILLAQSNIFTIFVCLIVLRFAYYLICLNETSGVSKR